LQAQASHVKTLVQQRLHRHIHLKLLRIKERILLLGSTHTLHAQCQRE
jgi:hypothetical protein